MQRFFDALLTLAVLAALAVWLLPRDLLSKGLESVAELRALAISTVSAQQSAPATVPASSAPHWVSDAAPMAVASDSPAAGTPGTQSAEQLFEGPPIASAPSAAPVTAGQGATAGYQPAQSAYPSTSPPQQAPQSPLYQPAPVRSPQPAPPPVVPESTSTLAALAPLSQGYELPAAGAQAAPAASNEASSPTALPRSMIIARVGDEVVLAGEVLSVVDRLLAENGAERMTAAQIAMYREQLVRSRLAQVIETKTVLLDLKRNIPPENLEGLWAKIDASYEDSAMKTSMKKMKIDSLVEFSARLRELGTSLEAERRSFREETAAKQWVRNQVDTEQEITHEEMLRYYQEHAAQFDRQARVRWEQVSAHFDRFSTKAAAYAALAKAGNSIIEGRPLADVAREMSTGSTAEDGGQFDWTNQGSLASTVLDSALFALPVGALSPIIEDDRGFHIIRVLEREPAGLEPFTEAQVSIKEKLRSERINAQARAYIDGLKETTPVWTIFDEQEVSVASLFPPFGSVK